MSWIRSALNRAAEAAGAGGKSIAPNLGRVRTYAGNVVHNAGNAVAGGAKIVLERASGKHYNNFKHAVRRLDEVSLHARGEERLQALARWLGALKDLDKDAKSSLERTGSGKDASPKVQSPRPESAEEEPSSKVAQVLFYDPEVSSEPLSFRDVFLRSSALENIVTSFILEAPDEEEIRMVTEMFGLCLEGAPELHKAIISGVQDLSKAVSSYHQVLVKRQDLLRMAADAITGLKVNAEVERLDIEAARLQKQIDEKMASVAIDAAPVEEPPHIVPGGAVGLLTDVSPSLKEGEVASHELVDLGTRLLELSRRRQALLQQQGDSEDVRSAKVEKLKVVAAELLSSAQSHKAKITEARQQKSDAMAYRVTKAQEVTEVEKVISAEMQDLQKKKEELETELNQVLAAIAVATKKHIHIQEEKEQFDTASSHIVAHLAVQEEELERRMVHEHADVEVVGTWKSFLEDTWVLQKQTTDVKESAARAAVSESAALFWKLAVGNLNYLQVEAQSLLVRVKTYVDELDTIKSKREAVEAQGMEGTVVDIANSRRNIEEKFVAVETQLKGVLAAVDKTRANLEPLIHSSTSEGEEGKKKKEGAEALLEGLSRCKAEFAAIARPELDIEHHVARSGRKGGKSSESWGRPGGAVVSRESSSGGGSSAVSSPTPSLRSSGKSGGAAAQAAAAAAAADADKAVPAAAASAEGDKSQSSEKDDEVDGWEFDDLEASLADDLASVKRSSVSGSAAPAPSVSETAEPAAEPSTAAPAAAKESKPAPAAKGGKKAVKGGKK